MFPPPPQNTKHREKITLEGWLIGTLRLTYTIQIRYDWVMHTLWLSYNQITVELWISYGWVMVTIRLCYKSNVELWLRYIFVITMFPPKIWNVAKKLHVKVDLYERYDWLIPFKYVTVELYILYDWVMHTLRLSYNQIIVELCIRYGWVIVTIQLCYKSNACITKNFQPGLFVHRIKNWRAIHVNMMMCGFFFLK